MSTIKCTVTAVTRRANSRSGNPTKVLHTSHGVFVTAMDTSVAYAISDLWENKAVQLTLDARGRVVDLEEA